jgi:hypothetical protein
MGSRALRPVVHWIGGNTGFLVRESHRLTPFSAVGVPLIHVDRHASALEHAEERGLDVMFDDEAWRNALPSSHPLRPPNELAWTADSFDPETAISPLAAEEFAEHSADAQIAARGTWLVSPTQHIRDPVPLSTGRRNEISIAHAFAAVVRSRGRISADPSGPQHERRALVGIGLALAGINQVTLRELIAAYAEVDADAFVIRLWRFSPSRNQYEAVRRIARELQQKTQRPCLVDGVGPLTYAALRNDIAGGVVGYGRSRIDPQEAAKNALSRQAEDRDGNAEDEGRGVPVWIPAILRGVPNGPSFESLRMLLLRELNCQCGAHRDNFGFTDQSDAMRHNFYWERQELIQGAETNPAQIRQTFGPRLQAVKARRRLARLPALSLAWEASLQPYGRPEQHLNAARWAL